VQVIAQISRRVQSAHIHNADSLPSIRALGHNTWRGTSTSANGHPNIAVLPKTQKTKQNKKLTLNLRIETLDVIVSISTLARHDLRHHHRRPRPLRAHNINQFPQPLVRCLPAVRVAIVRSGVQEDCVGRPADVGDGACDLVDRPARVAFVVFVREGAAAHAADVVDFGAGGG
jgi:hypothetical protein